MNKTRILAIFLVTTGVFLNYFTGAKIGNFFSGALIAAGIIWLITGKINFKRQ
jgi:hypothetical protein